MFALVFVDDTYVFVSLVSGVGVSVENGVSYWHVHLVLICARSA